MMATQPGHYIHHCWRYNQDPRLWAPAPVAVIYARKFGIAAMRWLPVRDAKRASIISLLIECNASGDPKQIRKTVDIDMLGCVLIVAANAADAGPNRRPTFVRPSPRFAQRDLCGLSGPALSAPRPAQASRWSRPPSSRAPR